MSTWATAFPQNVQTIATSSTTIGPFDVTPFTNAIVAFNGTYAGVTVIFECSSDGTNWYNVTAVPVNGGGPQTGSFNPGTNASVAYELLLGPFTSFRVRSTAYTSGTANVVVSFGNTIYDPSSSNYSTLVGAGSTTSANVAPAADAFTNQNGLVVVSQVEAFTGSTWDKQRTPNVFKAINGVNITSETTVWTPTAGKKFRLMGWVLALTGSSGQITFKDNTGGSVIVIEQCSSGTGGRSSPPLGNGFLSAAANNVLTFTGSGSVTVWGFVFGTEE